MIRKTLAVGSPFNVTHIVWMFALTLRDVGIVKGKRKFRIFQTHTLETSEG